MDDTIDLLKIKIEKAKRELPLETVNAIDSVDWRAAILGLRSKYGYTLEQLGDLETETELLLCGLVSPENYPKELENRMKIPKAAANELVSEMNNLIFKKIREELIKNTERKKIFQRSEGSKKNEANNGNDGGVLSSAGIEIIPDLPAVPGAQLMQAGKLELVAPAESREEILKTIEKPEETHPTLEQKLSGSVQVGMVKTEHTLDNITKTNTPNPANIMPQKPKVDPYREIPE